MDVKVKFRFNQVTGEVEVFEVTDEGSRRLPEAEHNREHDRISAELGNIIERNPQIMEVFANSIPTNQQPITEASDLDEALNSSENQEQRQTQ